MAPPATRIKRLASSDVDWILLMAIRPEMLTWARETAGLSLEDAARAIGLKEARGKTGLARLATLERGQEEAKPALLEKMAKAYRRPLLVFISVTPPKLVIAVKTSVHFPGKSVIILSWMR